MPSFARTRTVVKGASHVFDDEKYFDLCPLEEQEAEQPPEQVLEASQLFEDEKCFDLCPLEEEQEEGVVAEQLQVLATPQKQEAKVEKDRPSDSKCTTKSLKPSKSEVILLSYFKSVVHLLFTVDIATSYL